MPPPKVTSCSVGASSWDRAALVISVSSIHDISVELVAQVWCEADEQDAHCNKISHIDHSLCRRSGAGVSYSGVAICEFVQIRDGLLHLFVRPRSDLYADCTKRVFSNAWIALAKCFEENHLL